SWYLYRHVAKGSRWLEEPRSATVFLLLVAGAVAWFTACLHALLQSAFQDEGFSQGLREFFRLTSLHWLSRALGILAITPFCLVVLTPLLIRGRFESEPRHKPFGSADWQLGELLELIGLALGNGILAAIVVAL